MTTLTLVTEPIGKVQEFERDEIRNLHIRKSGLSEAFAILARTEGFELTGLYPKMVADMGQVAIEFQTWWDRTAKQYGWVGKPGKKWRIDFDTCEIFLD